ncbi:hypothetical protein O181_026145 [Austropuccinia psidii MF-1]|uniref:Uncharacterized protein n=1 Tax=Austropuccinia psidii MF-1 TaxID=1389203 RepID=A0A9Q3H1W5_9BASI|nr:hypothetical protein [Austropuccinia psidii MF-1]
MDITWENSTENKLQETFTFLLNHYSSNYQPILTKPKLDYNGQTNPGSKRVVELRNLDAEEFRTKFNEKLTIYQLPQTSTTQGCKNITLLIKEIG